jgi:hypothetical protein
MCELAAMCLLSLDTIPVMRHDDIAVYLMSSLHKCGFLGVFLLEGGIVCVASPEEHK